MEKIIKSKHDRELKKQWDAILKKEGLNENQYEQQVFDFSEEDRECYFEACINWCLVGKFDDELDQFIFEKHSDGLSLRDIERELSVSKFNSITAMGIQKRIQKILKQAGITPIEIRR